MVLPSSWGVVSVGEASERLFKLQGERGSVREWLCAWEASFQVEHGRPPSESDARSMPRVKAKYARLINLRARTAEAKRNVAEAKVEEERLAREKAAGRVVADSPQLATSGLRNLARKRTLSGTSDGGDRNGIGSSDIFAVGATPVKMQRCMIESTPVKRSSIVESTPVKGSRGSHSLFDTPSKTGLSTVVESTPIKNSSREPAFTAPSPDFVEPSPTLPAPPPRISISSRQQQQQEKSTERLQTRFAVRLAELGVGGQRNNKAKSSAVRPRGSFLPRQFSSSSMPSTLTSSMVTTSSAVPASKLANAMPSLASSPLQSTGWQEALRSTPNRTTPTKQALEEEKQATLIYVGLSKKKRSSKKLLFSEGSDAEAAAEAAEEVERQRRERKKKKEELVALSKPKVPVRRVAAKPEPRFKEISDNYVRMNLKKGWKQHNRGMSALATRRKERREVYAMSARMSDVVPKNKPSYIPKTSDLLEDILDQVTSNDVVAEGQPILKAKASTSTNTNTSCWNGDNSSRSSCSSKSGEHSGTVVLTKASTYKPTPKASKTPGEKKAKQVSSLSAPHQPEPTEYPFCSGHQMRCVLRTVKKANKNRGRQFFACSVGSDEPFWKRKSYGAERGCDFFMWADDCKDTVMASLQYRPTEEQFGDLRINQYRTQWEKCSMVQLKATLRKKGLSLTGKKADLVDRLVDIAKGDLLAASVYEQEYAKSLLGFSSAVQDEDGENNDDKDDDQGQNEGNHDDDSDKEGRRDKEVVELKQTEELQPQRRSTRRTRQKVATTIVAADEDDDLSAAEAMDMSESEDKDVVKHDSVTITKNKSMTGDKSKHVTRKSKRSTPASVVAKTLKEVFGFDSFRGDQQWAVERVLTGQSTLLVQATGSGKSLCYQLPALLLPDLTVVISPLVSLMEDQLKSLPVALPGAILSGSQSGVEIANTLNALRAGQIKVLFLSPERLFTSSFQRLLRTPGMLPEISLVCVDEAHCISSWSHNFRPSFLRLRELLAAATGSPSANAQGEHDLAVLNARCVLALTATATPMVVQDVRECLHIAPEGTRVGSGARSNLIQRARFLVNEDRFARVSQLLAEDGELGGKQSVVVYLRTRYETEAMADNLRAQGVSCKAYHGGMSASDRDSVQKGFMKGTVRVIIATVAFGMGIDKANIRGVIHIGLPRSVEDYVQEIGRGGRDGAAARCYTFFDEHDARRLHSLSHGDSVERSTLIELLKYLKERKNQRAIAIETERLALEWDVKTSVLETLLVYLSLPPFSMVKLMPSGYATVTVTFTRSQHVLAATNPVCADVLRFGRPSGDGTLRVGLVALAEARGESVAGAIRALSICKDANDVTLQFSDPALYVAVNTGAAENWDEIEKCADELWLKSTWVQQHQTKKVEEVFSFMALLSDKDSLPENIKQTVLALHDQEEPAIDGGAAEEPNLQSTPPIVQRQFRRYFEKHDDVKQEEHLAKDSSASVPIPFKVHDAKSMPLILSDIKTLMNNRVFREERVLSGLIAARILHGIQSPAFPAAQWSHHSLWGARTNYAFPELVKLATQVLRQSRLASLRPNPTR